MNAARPLPLDRSELDVAIEKIRARQPLTEHERALINRRGEELLADDFEDPPPGVEVPETDPDEDEAVLEDAVIADANEREGRRSITAAELFERLRAIG